MDYEESAVSSPDAEVGANTGTQDQINLLILNYFIYEGYANAARELAKELGLEFIVRQLEGVEDTQHTPMIPQADEESGFDVDDLFQLDTIRQDLDTQKAATGLDMYSSKALTRGLSSIRARCEIKRLVLEGHVEQAIEAISSEYPSLLERNQYAYFRLLHLQLIEKMRTHFEQDGTADEAQDRQLLEEVLAFINAKLSGPNILQSRSFLKELELTMTVLCFGGNKKIRMPRKIRQMLNPRMRSRVAELVNKSIILHTESVEGVESSRGDQYRVSACDYAKKPSGTSDKEPATGTTTTTTTTTTSQDRQKVQALQQMQSELKALEAKVERPEGAKLLKLVKLMLWAFGGCNRDGGADLANALDKVMK